MTLMATLLNRIEEEANEEIVTMDLKSEATSEDYALGVQHGFILFARELMRLVENEV